MRTLLRHLLLGCLLVTAGCATARIHKPLGYYVLDSDRLALLDIESGVGDTIGVVRFGDSLEVLTPLDGEIIPDNSYVVRLNGRRSYASKDLLMTDLQFRSKHSKGNIIHTNVDGDKYYVDETGKQIFIPADEGDTEMQADPKKDDKAKKKTTKPKKKKK